MLADRYEVLEEIGRGAMGVVHRARDVQLGRTVAVKLVSAGVAEDPELRRRFVREAHALARVHHPGIVAIYDVGVEGERPWLVMEMCAGGSLAARLAEGPLPAGEVRALVTRVAEALAAIHAAGVVHRDVTPGNVLLGRDGWVLGDFGVAAATGETAITRTGVVLGTPEYWAPEVIGEGPVGPAADVYSLGCVAFHALTGQPPYTGDNPLRVGMMHATAPVPRIPDGFREEDPALADAIEAMLAKDPAERPSVGDLAPGRTLVAPPRPAAPGPGRTRRAVRTAATVVRPGRRPDGRRRRGPLVATAVVAALLGAAGTVLGLTIAGTLRDDGAEAFVAPRLRGLTPAAAEERVATAASAAGADAPEVRVAEKRWSEEIAAGRVAAQRPAAGRDVRSGGLVRLIVSRGSARTDVPVVAVNGAPAGAIRALKARDLAVRVREEASFDVGRGLVIGTDPAAGTTVTRPATVTVIVSIGIPTTTVPDLGGREEYEAVEAAEDAGLVPVVEYEETDGADEGTVIAQDPAAGATADQRSELTITVAGDGEKDWEEVFRLEDDSDAGTPPLFVDGPWRISYEVTGGGFFGGDGSVVVEVESADGSTDGFEADALDAGSWEGPEGKSPWTVTAEPRDGASYTLVVEELR